MVNLGCVFLEEGNGKGFRHFGGKFSSFSRKDPIQKVSTEKMQNGGCRRGKGGSLELVTEWSLLCLEVSIGIKRISKKKNWLP